MTALFGCDTKVRFMIGTFIPNRLEIESTGIRNVAFTVTICPCAQLSCWLTHCCLLPRLRITSFYNSASIKFPTISFNSFFLWLFLILPQKTKNNVKRSPGTEIHYFFSFLACVCSWPCMCVVFNLRTKTKIVRRVQ